MSIDSVKVEQIDKKAEKVEKQKQLARIIAFYLPQFHPIPENDEWWGKGFTEWTNVTKAKPLFRGHHQPNLPSDLGFYDLRVPEVRAAQAELARKYGIEGFCYWHYWFGNGKRILERPFKEVLKSREPDFPFCLGWANQTWTGIWHGAPDRILIEQKYPGKEDYKNHFYEILEAFHDRRYLTIDGKKIFIIYDPSELPDSEYFTNFWRELAAKEGLGDLFFIGIFNHKKQKNKKYGCDAFTMNAPLQQIVNLPKGKNKNNFKYFKHLPSIGSYFFKKRQKLRIYDYQDIVDYCFNKPLDQIEFPLLLPNWDNTPRSEYDGVVLYNSNPELFRKMLRKALKQIEGRNFEHKVIFVKSWNEWAEGNYLEPDRKFGLAYLEAIKKEIINRSEEN
ncbi:MAG: glycoside hydrolase family 99-like domain-containing protein [Xenococcaceae cyanobacterium MO_188.B29]|nr:glycoside hydrolase family 99-like domain-containing protein [Xenococcaceae cyanobacterium MO_188.B29]